jgi:hypothetical protein
MRFEAFSFGSIRIDGVTYTHDVVINHGEIRKHKKKPSKKFRDDFGHTPLSTEEAIPWKCRGCGYFGTTIQAGYRRRWSCSMWNSQ